MHIEFYKYQGAGNDFVIIDDRLNSFERNDNALVKLLCDRKFGVGADGLMLLRSSDDYDFEMVYYNADGYEGSMCGNGGRCIVAFAFAQGIVQQTCKFIAVDGEHKASVIEHDNEQWVSLHMIDVNTIERGQGYCYLDTGSPHYVQVVENLSEYDVVEYGREVRNNDRFKNEGTNVNFIELTSENSLSIRTYERGVEDETLACGTGVTAAVLSVHATGLTSSKEINVMALGGNLKVTFAVNGTQYTDVFLQGPAELVFKGAMDVEV
ncbi:MAG: diaminopimelate epimerase [Saprospiraceae bacterium]|jgi:diaminopimelate epimerase